LNQDAMQAFHFDTIDSTNDAAKRMVADGRITGPAFLAAAEQTGGRGSRGRTWSSPKNAGIYLTVVDIPNASQATPPTTSFTLATGVACCEALRDTCRVRVRLKPVNDLYVDGRKLGGILTEAVFTGRRMDALMIGVGINLRTSEHALPAGSVTPVAIQELLPPDQFERLDVNAIVAALVHQIRLGIAAVMRGEAESIRHAWASHAIDGAIVPDIATA
jgi:BirA family transcriptional regulator, biotin operon repressor / biotin---[acetyl-CoA-carboxylase] ligase